MRDSNDGEEMNKMKLKGVMSGRSTTEMWGENSTGCLETVNCGVSSVTRQGMGRDEARQVSKARWGWTKM